METEIPAATGGSRSDFLISLLMKPQRRSWETFCFLFIPVELKVQQCNSKKLIFFLCVYSSQKVGPTGLRSGRMQWKKGEVILQIRPSWPASCQHAYKVQTTSVCKPVVLTLPPDLNVNIAVTQVEYWLYPVPSSNEHNPNHQYKSETTNWYEPPDEQCGRPAGELSKPEQGRWQRGGQVVTDSSVLLIQHWISLSSVWMCCFVNKTWLKYEVCPMTNVLVSFRNRQTHKQKAHWQLLFLIGLRPS